MRKISEIAGGIALLVYLEQRRAPNDMEFKDFRFRYDQSQWGDEPSYDEFQENLLVTADRDLNDLQNAIEYLGDLGLMIYKDDSDSAQKGYRDFHITARGVRVIESVDDPSPRAKGQFSVTFNFNLESIAKIAPTLKAQFGLVNI